MNLDTKKQQSNQDMEKQETIILLHPPNSLAPEGDQTYYPNPPLGLMMISSILKMHGYRVLILDLRMEALSGSPFEALKKSLTKISNPLAVGITTYTESFSDALAVAQIVKEIFPSTKVVMGGYHATFCYKETLSHSYVDFVVLGEGESTIIELLEYIKYPHHYSLDKIKGIAFRKDDEIVITRQRDLITDLDVLPFPDYNFSFADLRYGNTLPFISSRGCPGKCIFCASRAFSGNKYRLHSAEYLFSIVYYFYKKRPLTGMMAVDDTFTANKNRVKEFCNYLIKNNVLIGWGCRSRVDALLDENIVALLSKSNCVTIHIGIESAEQNVLDSIKKNISLNQVFKAIKLCRKYGIRIEASFMIGNPADTMRSMVKTILLAKLIEQNNIGISAIGISTPYPGTSLYQAKKEMGIKIKTKDWRKYNTRYPVFETPNFTQNDLRNFYFYVHRFLSKKETDLSSIPYLSEQYAVDLYEELKKLIE